MNCPFLRETSVSGCRSAHVRKLIPRAGGVSPDSICMNEAHRRCPGFVDIAETPANHGACPNLHESIAQYCAAAPVMKLIPYSESLLVRCGSGAFRYCDLFLEQTGEPQPAAAPGEDLPAPDELLYAGRHWWFDLPVEGPWHAGLDALSARLTGPVDRLGFIPSSAASHPAVVLTVASREFTFVFPEDLQITASNPQLRLHPDRIFESPYSQGWIYEGTLTAERREALRKRLFNSLDARKRMSDDACLINERLHHLGAQPGSQSGAHPGAALGDGGLFEAGLLAHLDNDAARALMHELASPSAQPIRK